MNEYPYLIRGMLQRLWEQCKARENEPMAVDGMRTTPEQWGISKEAFSFWAAQPRHEYALERGNAKARRRWRRKNLPNTQRVIEAGGISETEEP